LDDGSFYRDSRRKDDELSRSEGALGMAMLFKRDAQLGELCFGVRVESPLLTDEDVSSQASQEASSGEAAAPSP
jgi:hypothetical protein